MLKQFLKRFKRTTVYGLVGKSGTGKSFRAQLVAQKYAIKYIIDDGLLIHDDKILAGQSAKREKTFLAAVKTAVFDNKKQRDIVASMLQRHNPKKILILGTSDKMVNKIAMRLQIPPPQKIICIEDIATQEEIEKAQHARNIEGKHVIPVPSVEIKCSYPQIFYDHVRLLFKRKKNPIIRNEQHMFEKSVVRPAFSRPGSVKISLKRLEQMLKNAVIDYDQQIHLKKIDAYFDNSGYQLILTIDVPFDSELTSHINKLQNYITESIERGSGILIKKLNIVIDQMIQPK